MSQAMSFQLRVQGNNQAEIAAAAKKSWQEFMNDPEAELPWSTEMAVYPVPVGDVVRAELGLDEESRYYAEVAVTWSKPQS
jgi:hypothetical protein